MLKYALLAAALAFAAPEMAAAQEAPAETATIKLYPAGKYKHSRKFASKYDELSDSTTTSALLFEEGMGAMLSNSVHITVYAGFTHESRVVKETPTGIELLFVVSLDEVEEGKQYDSPGETKAVLAAPEGRIQLTAKSVKDDKDLRERFMGKAGLLDSALGTRELDVAAYHATAPLAQVLALLAGKRVDGVIAVDVDGKKHRLEFKLDDELEVLRDMTSRMAPTK